MSTNKDDTQPSTIKQVPNKKTNKTNSVNKISLINNHIITQYTTVPTFK